MDASLASRARRRCALAHKAQAPVRWRTDLRAPLR
jgi:hypothetical protein